MLMQRARAGIRLGLGAWVHTRAEPPRWRLALIVSSWMVVASTSQVDSTLAMPPTRRPAGTSSLRPRSKHGPTAWNRRLPGPSGRVLCSQRPWTRNRRALGHQIGRAELRDALGQGVSAHGNRRISAPVGLRGDLTHGRAGSPKQCLSLSVVRDKTDARRSDVALVRAAVPGQHYGG